MPEKDYKLPDYRPTLKNCLRDKVVDKIWHDLCEAFEMFPNEHALVSHNVVSVERQRIEAVSVDGFQSHLKYLEVVVFVEDIDCLSPKILDDAEKYCVEDLCRRVFVNVQPLQPEKWVYTVVERLTSE